MSGENHENEYDDELPRVAELLQYTTGESDAERDYLAGNSARYDLFSDVAEDLRSTYQAGYVAQWREMLERAARDRYLGARPIAIAEHAIYGDVPTSLAARVTFNKAVNVESDEHIETLAHYDFGTGKLTIDEAYKVDRNGNREPIEFRQDYPRASLARRTLNNIRERFNQWRR